MNRRERDSTVFKLEMELSELKEKIAKLKSIQYKSNFEPVEFIPEDGDEYWYVSYEGLPVYSVYNSKSLVHSLVNNTEVFRTKAEALHHAAVKKYQLQYKRYISRCNLELDGIDWSDDLQEKTFACYDYSSNKISFETDIFYKVHNAVYALDIQHIYDFIDLIGEDNFIEYVLGVKPLVEDTSVSKPSTPKKQKKRNTNDKVVVAHKTYSCDKCGKTISIGDSYRRINNARQGIFHFCEHCNTPQVIEEFIPSGREPEEDTVTEEMEYLIESTREDF